MEHQFLLYFNKSRDLRVYFEQTCPPNFPLLPPNHYVFLWEKNVHMNLQLCKRNYSNFINGEVSLITLSHTYIQYLRVFSTR